MGVFLAGGYIFQTLGMEDTTASNAGFITGLFVVLTPVLGALVLRHRFPGRSGRRPASPRSGCGSSRARAPTSTPAATDWS